MKKFGIIVSVIGTCVLGADNGWAAKEGATEETATVKCVKSYPFKIEGKFTNVPTPVSTSDFNYKCNAKFTDCNGSCHASSDTEAELKNKYSTPK